MGRESGVGTKGEEEEEEREREERGSCKGCTLIGTDLDCTWIKSREGERESS